MIASRLPSRYLLFPAALAAMYVLLQGAQSPKSGSPLTLEEVVKLSKSGVAEDLIITKIKKHGKPFDLSTEELLELKKVGVSDSVIKYLLDPAQPYTPAPSPNGPDPGSSSPAKATTLAKQYPEDPYAARVPLEPGLYRFQEDAPVKTDLKMLLGAKQGAGLGKILLKKGTTVLYLVGPASKTRISIPAPVFYLRLSEGKGIEEVVLLALQHKGDRREMKMGPGAKDELQADAMRQFDSLEVGPRLFKITAAKLSAGEYLFFLVGSAEPPKGNYGKGYDFGINQSASKPK